MGGCRKNADIAVLALTEADCKACRSVSVHQLARGFGYGGYRAKKYISTLGAALCALRAQQGIDRVGGAARKAGSAVGSYALGGGLLPRAGLKAAGAATRSAGAQSDAKLRR